MLPSLLMLLSCWYLGIDDTLYDHTSVLKYVLEKWAPESVGHLGERVRVANSLPVLKTPRNDAFPPYLYFCLYLFLYLLFDNKKN